MSSIQALPKLETLRLKSVADPSLDPHINGEYFEKHPNWHIEYSPWKAANVHRLMQFHDLRPRCICEVGCGAGEVLRSLQLKLDHPCELSGYDVAPRAIEMARTRENQYLRFVTADFTAIDTPLYDLMLILEVVDHVEDYFGFLRALRSRAKWKLFSFSLDISAQAAVRGGALEQRRSVHSHLHHFSKETALHALEYTGYKIVDSCYTSSLPFSPKAKLAKPIRELFFNVNADLTVRLFGGYSLLVLAR